MTAERTQRRIIAVGSGKGGVGKSTLTANLAIALATARAQGRAGRCRHLRPFAAGHPRQSGFEKPVARDKKLVPVDSAVGIPVLSMGHLVEPGRALAWRGPMAGNALAQLIDAHWGDVDTLLVDLPPGTGDVQLTMLQRYKPMGAVLVSTPQDLALIDAARAGQLFDQAGVPVIGLVENMAGYACPHCGEVSDPFGRGGVETAAGRLDLPFLGRIPLDLAIREGSDRGRRPLAAKMRSQLRFTISPPRSTRGSARTTSRAAGFAAAAAGRLRSWRRAGGRLVAVAAPLFQPAGPGPGEHGFGGWLTIAEDGVVTVALPQLEMGQGVTTVLAQVVAVELGADWRQVAIEPAPPAPGCSPILPLAAKWAPLWSRLPGLADDPDSLLAERFAREQRLLCHGRWHFRWPLMKQPLRAAAASARVHARRWRRPSAGGSTGRNAKSRPVRCDTASSGSASANWPRRRHARPARSAAAAGGTSGSEDPSPAEAELAPAFPRLDLPAKVDGSFLFAGDIRLPGMVYASIRHGPLGKAELTAFDEEAVAGLKGLVGVVKSKRYLAAVAESWWIADRALAAMKRRLRRCRGRRERGCTARARYRAGGGRGRAHVTNRGSRWPLARPDYAQDYSVAPAVHAAIETASATARFDDGKLELWIAAQAPELTPRGGEGNRHLGAGRGALSYCGRWQFRRAARTAPCDRGRTDRAADRAARCN